MIPMDSLLVTDEDNCVLGKGSTGIVVEAMLSNVTLLPMKVAAKVMVINEKGAKGDAEMLEVFEACKREVEILFGNRAKVGIQSTERMIQVIGVAMGQTALFI